MRSRLVFPRSNLFYFNFVDFSVFKRKVYLTKKVSMEFLFSLDQFISNKSDFISSFESSINCMPKKFRPILLKTILKVKKGSKISKALEENKIFPKFIINIIKSGESSSNISKSIKTAKNWMEWSFNENKNLKSSLAYPLFTLVIFSFIFYFFYSFLGPDIFEMVSQVNPDYDYSDNFIFKIFGFAKLFLYCTLFLAFCFFITFLFFKNLFFSLLLKVPFLGSLLKSKYIYFYSFYISQLMSNDFSISESLKIVISNSKSLFLKSFFNKVLDSLKKGKKFHDSLSFFRFFDEKFLNILKVSEESGNLESGFSSLYKFSFSIYQSKVKSLANKVPVFILFLTGFFILSFIYLVFYPIYNFIV